MHLTNELERRKGSKPKENPAGRWKAGGLAHLFLELWLLLLGTYFVGRVATRYAIAGYAGLDGHAWAEIILIPLFQAVWLLALRETFRGWTIFRRSVQAMRRYPALGVVLLLDLTVAPVLFWVQPNLLYGYLGLRCLFVAGFVFLLVRAGKLRGRGTEGRALAACAILLALPLALIQALRLLGPEPTYYPWLWSTASVILGFLLLNVVGIWSADSGAATEPGAAKPRSG